MQQWLITETARLAMVSAQRDAARTPRRGSDPTIVGLRRAEVRLKGTERELLAFVAHQRTLELLAPYEATVRREQPGLPEHAVYRLALARLRAARPRLDAEVRSAAYRAPGSQPAGTPPALRAVPSAATQTQALDLLDRAFGGDRDAQYRVRTIAQHALPKIAESSIRSAIAQAPAAAPRSRTIHGPPPNEEGYRRWFVALTPEQQHVEREVYQAAWTHADRDRTADRSGVLHGHDAFMRRLYEHATVIRKETRR